MSFHRDVQKTIGHGLGQPGLGDPVGCWNSQFQFPQVPENFMHPRLHGSLQSV